MTILVLLCWLVDYKMETGAKFSQCHCKFIRDEFYSFWFSYKLKAFCLCLNKTILFELNRYSLHSHNSGITVLVFIFVYSMLASGEADGRVCFWEWKNKRI